MKYETLPGDEMDYLQADVWADFAAGIAANRLLSGNPMESFSASDIGERADRLMAEWRKRFLEPKKGDHADAKPSKS